MNFDTIIIIGIVVISILSTIIKHMKKKDLANPVKKNAKSKSGIAALIEKIKKEVNALNPEPAYGIHDSTGSYESQRSDPSYGELADDGSSIVPPLITDSHMTQDKDTGRSYKAPLIPESDHRIHWDVDKEDEEYAPVKKKTSGLLQVLGPSGLRNAVIWSEILAKPIALREEEMF